MAKYINPFTDWGFKRLFGQEFSKDLLISFLNDLLEGELHVKDVVFKDKEQAPDQRSARHYLRCFLRNRLWRAIHPGNAEQVATQFSGSLHLLCLQKYSGTGR